MLTRLQRRDMGRVCRITSNITSSDVFQPTLSLTTRRTGSYHKGRIMPLASGIPGRLISHYVRRLRRGWSPFRDSFTQGALHEIPGQIPR